MAEKKVSRSALNKSFWTWFFWHGCSQQAESMLGIAFAHTMVPVIEELYKDDEEETSLALKRHLTLFNTEQQVGSICPGIAIAMEEQRANGLVTTEAIGSVKVALIGPTSAIGDSLWVATIIPILLTIAMAITRSAGTDGAGWLGPVIYLIAYPLGTLLLSNYLFKLGYKSGLEGVSKFMASGKLQLITDSLSLLGLLVVGALAASFVSFPFPIIIREAGEELVNFENLLNNIFPRILPLLLTLLVYYLYGRKKWSPMTIMLMILILAAVVTGLGYLFRVY